MSGVILRTGLSRPCQCWAWPAVVNSAAGAARVP